MRLAPAVSVREASCSGLKILICLFLLTGRFFKPSSRKGDRMLEFAPVNLHLQRMWVQNDTLRKSGFYDIVTVGAFTAHSHKSKNGGLIK